MPGRHRSPPRPLAVRVADWRRRPTPAGSAVIPTASKVFVITGRHRPHQLFLLLYGLTAGVLYAAGTIPLPITVQVYLAPWQQTLWVWSWIISGVAGLGGPMWRTNLEKGLRLEQGAMLLGSAPLATMAALSVTPVSWQAVIGVALIGAWALANLARAQQIAKDLKQIRDAALRA